MDINFLAKKWKEFENCPKYEEYKHYTTVRKKYILTTSEKVGKFIKSKMDLIVFKNVMDNIKPSEGNLRRRKIMSVWGADGFKGMMLFNMLIKYATEDELKKLSELLKRCISVPISIEEAKEKIDIFAGYVKDFSGNINSKRVFKINPQKSCDHVKIALNSSYSKTFIPVFWDMQELDKFPIYYTSCEQVIKKLGEKDKYYSNLNTPGKNYSLFYFFNQNLIRLIEKEYNKILNFSDISTNYLDYVLKTYIK